MARACQYGSVCTDKSATEEGERARHWIMLGEKVDRGNRQGWAWRRRSPFMSSSAIQRQQVSTPLTLAASARTRAPAQQAISGPLLWHVKRGGAGGGANDNLKGSFTFAALRFSLFAHARCGPLTLITQAE